MLNNITRRDIVGDVLTLFDYVEELERENERLNNVAPKIRSAEKSVSFIDKIMIERGKQEIFKWSTNNWNQVKCSYDEEANTYNFTSFDNWLDRKIDCARIPSSMSFENFVTYFKNELLEMYTKEKKEALRKAKEEE